MTPAEAVRAARERYGTRAEAAKAIGVSKTTLRGWERGSHLPSSLDHLIRAARVFDMTPKERQAVVLAMVERQLWPSKLARITVLGSTMAMPGRDEVAVCITYE